MAIYRVIAVLEYTKLDASNDLYPNGFTQWVEQYYIQTDLGVSSAVDAVVEDVRLHNIAYVFIRGCLVSMCVDMLTHWLLTGNAKHNWHYGTPPSPYVGQPNRCLMYGTVEPPNVLPAPIQIALRHRLVLSNPPPGRKMYHYIRSVVNRLFTNGIRSTAVRPTREYLPGVATQSDINAASAQHLSLVSTGVRLLTRSSVQWVAIGVRNGVTWLSDVTGMVEPSVVLTARTYRRKVYT